MGNIFRVGFFNVGRTITIRVNTPEDDPPPSYSEVENYKVEFFIGDSAEDEEFMDAVLNGRLEEVQSLIETGIDKITLRAAYDGLMDFLADNNISEGDSRFKIIELLIERGANMK